MNIAFGPAGKIAKRVAAGEIYDLLIMPAENVASYEKQGNVVPGSPAPLGAEDCSRLTSSDHD